LQLMQKVRVIGLVERRVEMQTKEEIRASKKAWKDANKEKVAAYAKTYVHPRPDDVRKRQKKWRADNKERVAAQDAARYAAKGGHHLTAAEKETINARNREHNAAQRVADTEKSLYDKSSARGLVNRGEVLKMALLHQKYDLDVVEILNAKKYDDVEASEYVKELTLPT